MNQSIATTQPREITLPGGVGTILLPAELEVEEEDEAHLLVYPRSDRLIEIRCSVMTATKVDTGENELKHDLRGFVAKKGGTYSEIGKVGVGEWAREDTSDPTVVRCWACAIGSSVVTFTATYARSDERSAVVARTLGLVPELIQSIRDLKSSRVIAVAGDTIEIVTSKKALDLRPFGPEEDVWLKSALNDAKQLCDGFDGSDTPNPSTLDGVLSKWMPNEDRRQTIGRVANALAAAFGSYLGDTYGYHWMVSSDEYGEEYVLQQNGGETVIHVVESVRGRLASGETDFFKTLERGLVRALVDLSPGS